jgi:hypothetical protein
VLQNGVSYDQRWLIGCLFVEIILYFYEGTKQIEERKEERKKGRKKES